MNKKIIGIFVCMLVMITAFSVSNIAIDRVTATITGSHQDGIVIGAIKGGFGITVRIKNTGTDSVSGVCTLTLSGLVFPKASPPHSFALDGGKFQDMTFYVIGLGPITIDVTANTATATATGIAILFLVLWVK